MVDGNTAALTAYEREIEKQEKDYEIFLESCREHLEVARAELDIVKELAELNGYMIDPVELMEEI